MHDRPIRHRRGRRTDLLDLLRLLAGPEGSVPVPDRRTLRRFRRLVADLGNDLYVAVVDERIVGFVHITYRRHLALGTRGRIEALVVDDNPHAAEIASSLVALVEQRARRRDCADVSYAAADVPQDLDDILVENGWVFARRELRLELSRRGTTS